MTKFCRDCFYARDKHALGTHWKCAHPNNELKTFNLVTGGKEYKMLCTDLRGSHRECGEKAAWFYDNAQAKIDYEKSVGIFGKEKKPGSVKIEDLL